MASARVSTIASSEAIGRVLKRGRRLRADSLSLFYLPRTTDASKDVCAPTPALPGRVAFIAGKRLGGAVQRNRAKRVMRAALDQVGNPVTGYDILLVANARTAQNSSQNIAQELSMLLSKAHI